MTKEDSLFCRFCPCIKCDGNFKNNQRVTGYESIPDPDFCKKEFKSHMDAMSTDKEIFNYDIFLRTIFALYGSSINADWKRFLNNPNY